jgi:hypothetical protein
VKVFGQDGECALEESQGIYTIRWRIRRRRSEYREQKATLGWVIDGERRHARRREELVPRGHENRHTSEADPSRCCIHSLCKFSTKVAGGAANCVSHSNSICGISKHE